MTKPSRNPNDDSRQPVDLFRTVKSKIAQRGGNANEDSVTIDLHPIGAGENTRPAEAVAHPVGQIAIGEVLRERFVIESRLGSGGMGTVYQALDRARREYSDIDCHVAIKVLHEDARGSPDVVAKLRREFYCAQALAHPNIVKVYELSLEHDFAFFTMELVDGELLSSVMQRIQPRALPRPYAWAVIRELGAGLAHAHERHVIHGDIKPRNVMVTNSGELRILDFGAAGGSAAALTPDYASCELLEGREPDPRDDLFALACLSYELLRGAHPFEHRRSTEARALNMTAVRPPGLTPRQWHALSKALSWEREARSMSIREWLAELELGNEPLGSVPGSSAAKPALLTKRKPMWPRLLAILAAILVCVILWAMLHRPAEQEAMLAAVPDVPASTPPTVDINALTVQPLAAADEAEEAAPSAEAAAPKASPPPPSRVDRTERIGIDRSAYHIGAGEKFAEIRVHRSAGRKDTTSFDWHTEPGSAQAAVDFVPQGRATMFFPAGRQTTSLFIKLVPNQSRRQSAVFYVVIDSPSAGTKLGAIPKAAIVLPPAR